MPIHLWATLLYLSFLVVNVTSSDWAVLFQIEDNDDVSFKWNQQQIIAFEDEGVVHNRISIIKRGNNDQNITVRVQVIVNNDTDEAQRGYDYDLLKDSFIFGNETQNLSVPFELYDGRIQLHPKHFYIAFTWDDRSLSMSIPPNEAKIFILNSIRFRGQPQNITTELDETAFFPCTREIDGNPENIPAPLWKINFSNGSTTIVMGRDNLPPSHVRNLTGLSVTVEDIELNFTAYTCYYLIYVPHGESYQPCAVYSNTGYLTINFPYTQFVLSLPAGSKTYINVGESVHFLVNKQGGGDFTFNVTINIDIIAPGINDTYQEYFTFNQQTDEYPATISIPHGYEFTTPAKVDIRIAEPIQVIEGDGNKQLTTNIGEAITITVYANVFFIGFTNNNRTSVNIAENKIEEICVKIREQDEVAMDPSHLIPLNIKLSQDPNCAGVKLDTDNVTLKSDPMQKKGTCFNVTFYDVKISCGETVTCTISINSTEGDYRVKFCTQEIRVIVTNESCIQAGPIIGVVIAVVTLLVILFVSVLVYRYISKSTRHQNFTLKRENSIIN